MLSQTTLNKLATLAGIKPEDLTAAIAATEEKEINIDDRTAYTTDELTTLKNNEYNNGKEKGVEMAIKDVKEKQGLTFQGKTIEGLVEAVQKKAVADAKIEPNQKVQELTEKITNLQKTVTDQEAALAAKDQEVTGVKVKGELYKHIPDAGENGPALGKDDVIQLMAANGYEFKLENGTMVPYKDGKVMTDKLSNAMAAKDVVSSFMKEKKLITDETVPGGRGGGNNTPPSKPMKLSELKKSYEAQGKSVLGEEFMKAVETAAADKEFDMKS